MTPADQILQQILKLSQRDPFPEDEIVFEGQEPMLPSRYLLATASAATIAAVGVAASDLWHLKTGRHQKISLDLRKAAVGLISQVYLQLNGQAPKDLWDPISGFYQTQDKRWLQLHCNFPHHRKGVLKLLKCENNREAVSQGIARWKGQELEDALVEAHMCVGMVRTRQEWEALPHAQAVAQLPLFEIIKIGESAPEPLPEGDRPLSGIRALDLTRVIAGPIGGRTLAEHGADVMRISAAHLPSIETLVMDTGHGKLSVQLNLHEEREAHQLKALTQKADIFSQSYRPGTLAARGFSPETVAQLRPGIIYATLSAYGHAGPWQQRRGFDSLVQSVSGMVAEVSTSEKIRHVPAQVLDYVSGYLMAFGAMIALARRARQGGSYLVRVSLCQTAQWLHELGRLDDETLKNNQRPKLGLEDIQDLLQTTETPFGTLRHLAPIVQMSETPARWTRPAVPLGTHDPRWPQ